jgi:hypothetical protein
MNAYSSSAQLVSDIAHAKVQRPIDILVLADAWDFTSPTVRFARSDTASTSGAVSDILSD